MAIYALADLHLSLSNPEKSMELFGKQWAGYIDRIVEGFPQDAYDRRDDSINIAIIGKPNVGKSSLINRLTGKKSAQTGDKPGVTKGKQWIKINKNIELLDTPGILWPKFEDDTVGKHLAFIGSINDEILQKVELTCELIDFLKTDYPGTINGRYGVDEDNSASDILSEIAKNRGCLMKGNELDYEKAAMIVLDEFRGGVLGRMSVERP